jgi:hypothetical protein
MLLLTKEYFLPVSCISLEQFQEFILALDKLWLVLMDEDWSHYDIIEAREVSHASVSLLLFVSDEL